MTVEEIKKAIKEAEASCVYEIFDSGYVDVLISKRKRQKGVKRIGYRKISYMG